MELNVGHQGPPPPPPPPPPICGCCYRGNSGTSQIEREIFRGHHLSSIPLAFYHTLPQEAINREIEKNAIRQEIIASETARRKRLLLEYEVRREVMAQVANDRDPGLIVNTTKPTTEHAEGCDRGLSFTRPAQRSGEGEKPYKNISGLKKKAESPPPGEIVNTKKPKKGWSCEICQINTTCEQALAGHLRGRKHKAKEAESGLPTLGENEITNKDWSCEICQIISTSAKALSDHLQGRKHQAKEAAAGFRAKNRRKIPTFDPSAEKEAEEKPTTENSNVRKRCIKRYPYWCDTCKMGAGTMKTFLKHKEHRHNARTGQSPFEGRDRIHYTRDLLIQLREAVAQVPEDILKLKQEVEAEFCLDPSWSRGENDARLCAAQDLDINSEADEFKRKSNSLLEDYFSAMLVEVVRESILSGVEKSPPCVETVLKLLTSMYGEKDVNANDIEAGCLLHAESLEDLSKAPDSFGEIVGGLVLTGIFDFKVVGEILGKIGDDFYGNVVFSGVMKVVGSGPGGKEVLDSQADDVKACENLF